MYQWPAYSLPRDHKLEPISYLRKFPSAMVFRAKHLNRLTRDFHLVSRQRLERVQVPSQWKMLLFQDLCREIWWTWIIEQMMATKTNSLWFLKTSWQHVPTSDWMRLVHGCIKVKRLSYTFNTDNLLVTSFFDNNLMVERLSILLIVKNKTSESAVNQLFI